MYFGFYQDKTRVRMSVFAVVKNTIAFARVLRMIFAKPYLIDTLKIKFKYNAMILNVVFIKMRYAKMRWWERITIENECICGRKKYDWFYEHFYVYLIIEDWGNGYAWNKKHRV